MLLCKLLDWATQPQFVYHHEWELGDLLMWDNTGTMHCVTPYDPKAAASCTAPRSPARKC